MLANANPWVLAGIAIGMQWVAAIPAVLLQSEQFYDAWGSLTFVTTTLLSTVSLIRGYESFSEAVALSPRAIVALTMVLLWSLRLGSFLIGRMMRDGKDRRFDKLKTNTRRFVVAWTLQGVWVSLDAVPAWILAHATLLTKYGAAGLVRSPDLDAYDAVLIGLWLSMLVVQSLADNAKYAYKQIPVDERPTPWIQSGLWALSRHPNYAAEIIMWWILATVAARGIEAPGMFWTAQLAPTFTTLLLYCLTGPMLERKQAEEYGTDARYLAYYRRTPYILPLVPCPVDPFATKKQ